MRPSMAASAPEISAGSRSRSAGSRNCTAATMLSSVSPVMSGADAASPQPVMPLSDSIRTSTLSARRTSSPAMITGLSIGRLTGIGSMLLIFTARVPRLAPLHLFDAGLVDDVLEQADFLGDPRPGGIGAFRAHQEAGFVELVLHFSG